MFSTAGKTLAPAYSPSIGNNAVAVASAPDPYRAPDGLRFQHLTPESLLAYCAMKLRDLDGQVQVAFASQKQRGAMSEKLSALQSGLENAKEIPDPGAFEGDERIAMQTVHGDAVTKIEKLYNEAVKAAGGAESELGSKLAGMRDQFLANAKGQAFDGDAPNVDPTELQGFAKDISRVQADLNNEGEIEMIQLQSLMSNRQQAIQMCTNMISGLGQSSMSIAQNIGK